MKKFLALFLILGSVLSLLAGCGKEPAPSATPETPDTTQTPEAPVTPAEPIVLVEPEWAEPVYEIEEALENRQKALSATAAAYYYKGILNQYGLQDLNIVDEHDGGGLRGKTLERNSPEENTVDQTLYQWCSSYMYDVVYHTMGYRISEDYRFCRTNRLVDGTLGDDSLVVYKYTLTGVDTTDRPVIDEIIANLQPGDIVTYTIADVGGHSLMVVEDMTGDGIMDILHRSGARYDMSTGKDKKETYGINRDPLEAFRSGTRSLYEKEKVSVVRMTNLDPAKYPLTQSAKARMAWPGLRIDRTVEGGVYGAVTSGSDLTYNIAIMNCGTEALKGLPVMDKLDPHCTMVSQDGKPATTTFPVWTVDVAPGETVNLTYTVKVEGNPGELVVSEGGSVAGIPSNRLVTTIRAYTPDAEKLQSEADAAAAAAADGLDFVNKLYEAATGVNPGIPSMEEIRSTMFEEQPRGGTTSLYTLKADAAASFPGSIHIPTYLGGRLVLTPDNERVLETRPEDLMPGDIIIADGIKQNKKTTFYWIYNGERLVEWNNGKPKNVTDSGVEKLLSYDFFVALRPSLAKAQ